MNPHRDSWGGPAKSRRIKPSAPKKYKETIKSWPPNERPRERIEKFGPDFLSEAELLAVIIRSGDSATKKNAIDLARALISRFRSLKDIDSASIPELCQVPGIGPAKAAQIKSALELGKRFMAQSASKLDKKFTCSEDVVNYFTPKYFNAKKEVFHTILLSTKNRVIKDVVISEGSLDSSLVHPREVFKPAIQHSAASIICVHNHPSGDPQPSQDDIELTRRLADTSRIIGIRLLDHIIIGGNRYFSFMDESLLK